MNKAKLTTEEQASIFRFMVQRLNQIETKMAKSLVVKEKCLLRRRDVDILGIMHILGHVGLMTMLASAGGA